MGRFLPVVGLLLVSPLAHAECENDGGAFGFLKDTFEDVQDAADWVDDKVEDAVTAGRDFVHDKVDLAKETFEVQTPGDLLPWNRGGDPGTRAKLPPCDDKKPGLKMMTYNIRSTRDTDMNHIARDINASAPDFVALQEVDVNAWRTGRRNQPKELAEKTGLKNTAFYGIHRGFFIDQYGNAILSKYQILETRTYKLPSSSAEQRTMLCVKVKAPMGETMVCNTHLGLNQAGMKDERVRQVNYINGVIRGFNTDRVVLMGDFNETANGPAMRLMRNAGLRDSWNEAGRGPGYTSIPSNPTKKIDYIMLGRGLSAGCASVPKVNGSDHLPIVTTVY